MVLRQHRGATTERLTASPSWELSSCIRYNPPTTQSPIIVAAACGSCRSGGGGFSSCQRVPKSSRWLDRLEFRRSMRYLHPWRASRFEVVSHMPSASRHRQFVRRGNSRSLMQRPGRRVISLLVLLGILCSFFPLPAPPSVVSGTASGPSMAARSAVRPIEKDRSRPFPCAQRVCGCRSAEQCWKKCCCFTDAQKVAWADAQGVELPAFVRESAARALQTDGWTAGAGKHRRSQACARCEHRTPADTGSVGGTVSRSKRPGRSERPELASGVVIVQDALACQGIDWQWQFDPGTAPRSPVVSPGVEPPPVHLPGPTPPVWRNPSPQVPVPPPRASVPPGSSA
jgi:hypothetical protein